MAYKYKHRPYSLRVPLEYREKLSYIAGENLRSLNGEIELLMKERIDKYEIDNGAITPEDIEEFKRQKQKKV